MGGKWGLTYFVINIVLLKPKKKKKKNQTNKQKKKNKTQQLHFPCELAQQFSSYQRVCQLQSNSRI
jgi:hypothetical protein